MTEIEQMTKCPDCEADLREYSRFNLHTNGRWNETAEFRCGAKYHFVPNYMRVVVLRECPHSLKQKAIRDKRITAHEKLIAFVDALDVDQDWKDRIFQAIGRA